MRWSVWTAFGTLCLLSGTSWAIAGVTVGGLPPLEQQGFLFAAIGVAAFFFADGGLWLRMKGLRGVRLGAGAVGFFGVPVVVAEYARGSVPAISRSALFAMTPVVVVMMVASSDAEGEARGARRFLLPALVGLGGLLLLLPLEFSGSVRGRIMLAVICAAVVLVGLASVWLFRLLRGMTLADAVAIVGLTNAVFFLAWSAVREEFVWRWGELVSVASISSLLDVVEVLLIVRLLREMQPVRFAARYLFIPLVTVLESYVLMRPEVTVRMVSGTVLLAVGAGMLLLLHPGEEEMTLSLR
jgi:drug/metabolite transporter (DMT)-like permease